MNFYANPDNRRKYREIIKTFRVVSPESVEKILDYVDELTAELDLANVRLSEYQFSLSPEEIKRNAALRTEHAKLELEHEQLQNLFVDALYYVAADLSENLRERLKHVPQKASAIIRELAEAKADIRDFIWAWHMSPSIKSGFSTMHYADGEISCVVECQLTASPIERIRVLREEVERLNALREKVQG